ncbi:MAG: DUF87 domain-containing protein [Candidatus Lokiarchaeota archaeon]|nr:DUF87 domain-containing protein [Candidatus Lokiarchaeota archaeon]
MLDKGYGRRALKLGGVKGRVLHEAQARYYRQVFKRPERRSKLSQRVFSKWLTEEKVNVLADLEKSPDSALYHEDAKLLLEAALKAIRYASKRIAAKNGGVVVPEDVEREAFGGELWIEEGTTGKIGGIKISGRTDYLIELDLASFVVRDFKSFGKGDVADPTDPESPLHREFMQACLYAVLFEKSRRQACVAIQVQYFPCEIVSHEFTTELRQRAMKYAKDQAFEGYDGVSFNYSPSDGPESDDDDGGETAGVMPAIKQSSEGASGVSEDRGSDAAFHPRQKDDLGFLSTIKGKPLELVLGGDNKMEGYLFPSEAHRIREGHCVVVEDQDTAVRILCVVKKIECSEDQFPGETSSHKEENYKIALVPEGQFGPEGYQELRPQTVIGGRIKVATQHEYCAYKRVPVNGMPIGTVQGLNEGIPYPLDRSIVYQSVFVSGQQGTGKTSFVKCFVLGTASQKDAPAQVILDHEGEYENLVDIPTNERSRTVLEKIGAKGLDPDKFKVITLGPRSGRCLSLEAIDSFDLPNFLHELTPISHDTFEAIVYDLKQEHDKEAFLFPELKSLVLSRLESSKYGATSATQGAIKRALNSVALKIFDVPGSEPIDVDFMLEPGRVTVVNTYNLRGDLQRIVGLYLLAVLHGRALKGKKRVKTILYLDEIQRLVPKSNSQAETEYLRRIIKYLDEVVHRGRKRDYGVFFATQSVGDVKKDIIDLCNTKFFMQAQGSGAARVKDYFTNKADLERLKKLPKGHAFVTSEGKHEPVEIKFPFVD